jgi:putative NADH-flavin reductase
MRIAVLGAHGRTGREVVAVGRSRGHDVIPVVRRARGDGDRIADGRDTKAMTTALADADAVISTIGAVAGSSDPTVMHDSMVATLAALPAGAHLVVVTASGPVVAGDDPLTRFIAKPILWRVFGEVWRDFIETEAVVTSSDAAWTIARPPMLHDGAARGRYRQRRDGNVRWGFSIRRADLAAALLDAIDDPTTVRAVISYAN